MKTSIVLVWAVACVACSSRPEGARLDPALRLLVPAETKMLAAVQVEELVKSPFYKKHLAQRTLPQIQEFRETTGIDIANLWEVMVVSDGERVASLARGKFAPLDTEPAVKFPGERTRYRSYSMIGNDQTSVLLLGSSMVGIGDTALLKRVVDTRGEANGPKGVIEARMKEIPYEAEAWAVYRGSPAARLPLPQGKNATVMARAAESIQSVAVYFDAGTLLTLDATLHSDADANAKQLHSSLRGLLGLGQAMSAEFKQVLQSVQLTQEAKKVHLRVESSGDTLVPLLERLQ